LVAPGLTRLFALACALILVGAGSVLAQPAMDTGEAEGDAEGEAAQPHPRGTYLGVKPGGPEQPAVKVGPGIRPSIITWPGFTMLPDGGSRVFLQLSAAVDIAHQAFPNKVVVDLQNARIAGHTNRYPLETRFFNTPVMRATVKRTRSSTTLEITLRAAATPYVSGTTAQSGYYFVYVDFPPGQYLTAETTPAADEPPAPDEPAAAPRNRLPAKSTVERYPTHFDAAAPKSKAKGGAKVDTSMDHELPPGMGEVKAGGKTSVKGKAGF
jgi:hypothetical protein